MSEIIICSHSWKTITSLCCLCGASWKRPTILEKKCCLCRTKTATLLVKSTTAVSHDGSTNMANSLQVRLYFAIKFQLFHFISTQCLCRMNRRAVAMMFVCPSVCMSIRLSETGVHCDHTVHFSADLSLWLCRDLQFGCLVNNCGMNRYLDTILFCACCI